VFRDGAPPRQPDGFDARVAARRPTRHGWDAVYTLSGELYRSQWLASEALARDDLATHQDALAAPRRSHKKEHC
jgi:hypothetical protein